jgi:hypothetical protein
MSLIKFYRKIFDYYEVFELNILYMIEVLQFIINHKNGILKRHEQLFLY